ncbi:MAG: hypothetical protein JSR28_10780 [Proteobacteria bacterium]|nr:hypothetical protein [Pseudomonadota bacterium]MDE2411876.1 hypothetical protein [Sphingomonadales bacterium]
MHLVRLETQGESQAAMINPDQIAYLAEGLYGTSVHFASGEYLICSGELDDVARKLFGARAAADALIASTALADG